MVVGRVRCPKRGAVPAYAKQLHQTTKISALAHHFYENKQKKEFVLVVYEKKENIYCTIYFCSSSRLIS